MLKMREDLKPIAVADWCRPKDGYYTPKLNTWYLLNLNDWYYLQYTTKDDGFFVTIFSQGNMLFEYTWATDNYKKPRRADRWTTLGGIIGEEIVGGKFDGYKAETITHEIHRRVSKKEFTGVEIDPHPQRQA